VRYGTAALTTRGMGEEEMKRVAIWIDSAVKQKNNIQALDSIKKEVKDLCLEFPVSSL
jgi:glycine hydroxymethyltransferase